MQQTLGIGRVAFRLRFTVLGTRVEHAKPNRWRFEVTVTGRVYIPEAKGNHSKHGLSIVSHIPVHIRSQKYLLLSNPTYT